MVVNNYQQAVQAQVIIMRSWELIWKETWSKKRGLRNFEVRVVQEACYLRVKNKDTTVIFLCLPIYCCVSLCFSLHQRVECSPLEDAKSKQHPPLPTVPLDWHVLPFTQTLHLKKSSRSSLFF